MSDAAPLALSPAAPGGVVPLAHDHATERREHSLSRYAISSRFERLTLTNVRAAVFFFISLAAAVVALVGLLLAFTAPDSHVKSELILSLSLAFAFEVGSLALVVASFLARVNFGVQITRDEAWRGDFCFFDVLQLVDVVGWALCATGALLYGWALTAVLRANDNTWFTTYPALVVIPLAVMIAGIVCACAMPLTSLLPPCCLQRAWSSWPDRETLDRIGSSPHVRGRWALAMARAQDWLAYRRVAADAPPGTTAAAIETNDAEKLGWRALHWAAYHNDDGLAQHVIEMARGQAAELALLYAPAGGPGPAAGQNPLHVAAVRGAVETCRVLVSEAPATALATTWAGRTPLEVALELENYRVASVLAKALDSSGKHYSV
jgi:hypothetical protein